MRNPGKAWEISGKYGKSRETPENPGKPWGIFLVYIKFGIRYEEFLLPGYVAPSVGYQKKGLDPRINPG